MQIGRFANGQIAERWGSADELTLMSQLGASPNEKQGVMDKLKDAVTG